MSGLTSYLFGIVGVCLIASVAKQMLSISGHYKSLGNTIIGIFLVFSVLSPVVALDWNTKGILDASFASEFDQISQDANSYQQQALRQSITVQTEAYIWNKAKELSLDIELEITLSDSYPYAPCGVRIIGNASPYAKTQLSSYIAEQIGIPKEAQTWISASP